MRRSGAGSVRRATWAAITCARRTACAIPLASPARLAGLAEGAGATIAERSHVIGLRRRGDEVVVSFVNGARSAGSTGAAVHELGATVATPPARVRGARLRPRDRHRATRRLDVERASAGASPPGSPTPAISSTTTGRRQTDASSSAAGRRPTISVDGSTPATSTTPPCTPCSTGTCSTVHPALEGTAISHAWGGAVDSTSRFTPTIHTAAGGRIGWAVGFTGLGVGASRFGALAALDLLLGRPDAAHRSVPGESPARAVPTGAVAVAGHSAHQAGVDQPGRHRPARAVAARARPGRRGLRHLNPNEFRAELVTRNLTERCIG